MSRGRLTFLLALSFLLNLSVLASAGYRYVSQRNAWTSPFGTKMARDRFLFEELSLTREQTQAMRKKAVPFRAEIDRRRAEIAAKRKELLQQLRAAAPDDGAIDATIAQITALQHQMQREITRQMLEQKALLTAGQQERFIDLIENAMLQGAQ